MEKSNSFRTGRHCVFAIHAHLVFVTKYRKKVFNKGVMQSLKEIFAASCGGTPMDIIKKYIESQKTPED
jgi:putative transposase